MTDFLDRYGLQLRAARRRRRRRAVRVSLLAVASPAVAAVAVVLATSSPDVERPATPTATATTPPPVGTWTPEVGRPDKGMPMSIDRTPVSPTATKVLAVLRRPQTDRDRRLAGPRLRYVGPPGEGLQVDGVRALNARYALVPLKRHGTLPGPAVCILGSRGGGCSPVSQVARHGVASLTAGEQWTRRFGIVPDGVTRVRFTPRTGRPVETVVRENFYELRIPAPGPGLLPAQGTLEWIDGKGNATPQRRR